MARYIYIYQCAQCGHGGEVGKDLLDSSPCECGSCKNRVEPLLDRIAPDAGLMELRSFLLSPERTRIEDLPLANGAKAATAEQRLQKIIAIESQCRDALNQYVAIQTSHETYCQIPIGAGDAQVTHMFSRDPTYCALAQLLREAEECRAIHQEQISHAG